jgi:LPXTG-motif cell wall-anchored protein
MQGRQPVLSHGRWRPVLSFLLGMGVVVDGVVTGNYALILIGAATALLGLLVGIKRQR